MDKKNYEDILGETSIDYVYKFIQESLREIKNGNPSYIYSLENLQTIEKILKTKNIKYEVQKSNNFWTIVKR